MDYSNSNQLDERKHISVFDTTLRDGEQSALCTMFLKDKLEIALGLEELGVDVIEAGFAGSNGQNFETIQKVCEVVKNPHVCSLARCRTEDIETAYDSMKAYDKRMIHLFMPTSEVQVFDKMGKNYETIEKMIRESIRLARKFFDRIEVSCEDATRTDIEVLKRIYKMAIEEGAGVVNIPDTVGFAYPESYGKLIRELSGYIKELNPQVVTSVHCHNDIGLAGVNSFYGILNGAEQVECAINGIGERAGNCALEQIIGHEIASRKFSTGLDSRKIWGLSQKVSRATETRNDFAPITGICAFSHKAGIHQHGVLTNSQTYESLDAEKFGRKTELVMGPHSGYHGVVAKAKELGIELSRDVAHEVICRMTDEVRQEKQRVFSDEDVKKIVLKTLQDSIN
jgi:2-isopropylmalate synthase